MKRHFSKMKVLMALILSLTLLVITACNGTNGNKKAYAKSGVTNVVFWDLFGGADGTTMNAIVKKFNQTHPHIHIQEETQNWGQYYTKLITAVLGGVSPDLGISHVDHLAILKTQGVIEPLGKEAKAAGIDWSKFYNAPMKDAVINGKHYAIPLDIHTLLLFYNKSVLKKAGISPDQLKITSYDQFVRILKKVKKNSNDVPLSFPEGGWVPLGLWSTFYKQMDGGPYLNKNRTRELFTSPKNMPKAVAAMQKLYDLYNTSNVIADNISNTGALFMSGKAAFTIDGTWNVDTFHKALGNKLGVAQMPVFFDKPAAFADSHTFILPKNPKRTPEQTKAAMTFVKWVEVHAWMWAKAGHIPANKTVIDTPQYQKMPYRSNYAAQGKHAIYFPMTKKVWMMSDNQLLNAFQKILLKEVPVKQGVQELGNILNRQLQY